MFKIEDVQEVRIGLAKKSWRVVGMAEFTEIGKNEAFLKEKKNTGI